MRLEIVAVALQDVLGFENGIANAPGAGVKLRQGGVQVVGIRIVLNGEAIFVNRFVGVVGAAIHRDHLFVHVRQCEVIVGRSLVGLLRRSRRLLGWRGSRRRWLLRRAGLRSFLQYG